MSSSRISVLRDAGAYLKAAGYGWWIAVAAPFGFWDQIARFLPPSWNEEMPSWLPEAVAAVALLVGPFLAWRKQRLEFLRLQSRWWQAFAKSRIEAFFGEQARMTPQSRFEELGKLFDERKGEIERGDYSRAAEIFPIVEAYVPLLAQCVPLKSVAYPMREKEIKEAYNKAEEYMKELGLN